MLGTNTSTRGSTRASRAPQSIIPEGLEGSGRLMSREVMAPRAFARANSLSSRTPPSDQICFMSGG